MRFNILIICFTFVSVNGYAQREVEPEVELILESVADNVAEDYDFSDLIERLNQYKRIPLNINSATAGQLAELLILSPVQIGNLKDYIVAAGPLLAIEELQSIEGFDQETIRKLLPFVTLSTRSINFRPGDVLSQGKGELMVRYGQVLQRQKGYFTDPERSHYLGDPRRYLARFRFNYNNRLLVSFNAEKDAGEPFFTGQNKQGFDFYSGSVALINNTGLIRKIIAGDFSLQFGQGLSLYTGLSFGKGADITTIPKVARGLTPYTSTNEVLFFRGIATTLAAGNFRFTPFVSFRKIDASINSESNLAGSMQLSGYHRTANELDNRSALSMSVAGGNLLYSNTHMTIGALGYYSTFSKGFAPGKYLYNQFDFAGASLINTSVYSSATFRNTYIFAELSKSLGYGLAYVGGAMLSVSPSVSMVLFYRNYGATFQSFFNQAISEGSFAVNERGFYSGVQIKLGAKWAFTGYADAFRFPWLKYRVDAPGSGYEYLGQLLFSPAKKVSAYLRYRFETKPQNEDTPQFFSAPEDVKKQNLRLDIGFPVGSCFTLHYRAEGMIYQKQNDRQYGRMIYQDIAFRPPVWQHLSAGFRLAWFKTDSYDSRIYAFENDVLYSYSIPAYFGDGLRAFVNTRVTFKRGLDVWARFAVFSYQNQQTVGSGLEEISGNRRSDLKIQIRYQF